MAVVQKEIRLPAMGRGFHLITHHIEDSLPEIGQCKAGLLNIFVQHTSASLTINENADPSARRDLENYFDRSIPENDPAYTHTYEGADDMPAHIKSSVLGTSLNIPVANGRLALGTWQGIYLCEHRDHGGRRDLVLTLQSN